MDEVVPWRRPVTSKIIFFKHLSPFSQDSAVAIRRTWIPFSLFTTTRITFTTHLVATSSWMKRTWPAITKFLITKARNCNHVVVVAKNPFSKIIDRRKRGMSASIWMVSFERADGQCRALAHSPLLFTETPLYIWMTNVALSLLL